MKSLRVLLFAAAAVAAFSAAAQESNHGDGDPDGICNVFINTSTAFQLDNYSGDWAGAFRAKHLRLEIKGQFGDHLTYRLRHRLNAPNAGASLESFSKATDFMMIGYHFNDKFTLFAGKMSQFWGGYDYDENPLYIYEEATHENAAEAESMAYELLLQRVNAACPKINGCVFLFDGLNIKVLNI